MQGLAHLVARATGQAKSGLSPRIASRFEAASTDWTAPVEITGETPATDTLIRPHQDQAPNAAPLPPSDSEEKPSRVQFDPVTEPSQPQPSSDPQPFERDTAQESAPSLSAVNTASPPEPLYRDPSPLVPVQHPRTKPDSAPKALATRIHSPDSNQDLAPPELLLAAQKVHPGRTAHPGPTAPEITANVPQNRRVQSAPLAEPAEIVIHIGRLDVVAQSEPAKPVQQRQQRRPQMTRLGDYLKGKGGST